MSSSVGKNSDMQEIGATMIHVCIGVILKKFIESEVSYEYR